MKFSRNLFGSRLDISIFDREDIGDIVEKCFRVAEDFEQTYSRFKKGNFLDTLNTEKSSEISSELSSILQLCLRVSKLTDGYFDITLLPLLENMGYGKSRDTLRENVGYENISLDNNTLILKNGISIDLGAVGKGYIVDKIYNTLDTHSEEFIINFGGDLRIKGSREVFLEDPYDDTKSIGSIIVENTAIASSSGNKRKIGTGHHLVNPKTKKSQNDKIALYVTHRLASFADIFSTALFVTPLQKSLEILEQTKGLEALIIASDGSIYKSKGFTADLNIS